MRETSFMVWEKNLFIIMDSILLKWFWNHGGFVMFYALHPVRQTRNQSREIKSNF